MTISQAELTPHQETESAVLSFQPPPLTLPAKPAVTASDLEGEVKSEERSQEPALQTSYLKTQSDSIPQFDYFFIHIVKKIIILCISQVYFIVSE